jgi:hypothetical protein
MSTQRSSSERHFRCAIAQRSNKYTTQINSNKVKHHGEANEVQPMACHVKMVARGGGQGPATPRRRPLPPWRLLAPPSAWRWHVPMLWRCNSSLAKIVMQHCFSSCINRGHPSSPHTQRGKSTTLEHHSKGLGPR